MGDGLRHARWLRSELHDRLCAMRAKSLPIVSSEELATWHTGSLLKRIEGLRKLDPSPELSDIAASDEPLAPGHIYFKSTEAWQVANPSGLAPPGQPLGSGPGQPRHQRDDQEKPERRSRVFERAPSYAMSLAWA